MQLLLDKSWAIALDSLEANENDLEALFNLLLDEGKSRIPLHQRHIQFLRVKKVPNKRNGEWIERSRTLQEVEELDKKHEMN